MIRRFTIYVVIFSLACITILENHPERAKMLFLHRLTDQQQETAENHTNLTTGTETTAANESSKTDAESTALPFQSGNLSHIITNTTDTEWNTHGSGGEEIPITTQTNHEDDDDNDSSSSSRSSTPLPWYLQETKIVHTSPGTTTLRNICVQQRLEKQQGQNDPVVRVHMVSFNQSFEVNKRRRRLDYITNTHALPWDLWEPFAANATYIPHHAVWIDACQDCDNVGHCMNDMVFSYATQVLDYEKESNDRETMIQIPFYRRYIRGNLFGLQSQFNNACFDMVSKRFGLIAADTDGEANMILPQYYSDNSNVSEPICFASLTVPRLAELRHTRNDLTNKALVHLQQRMFRMMPTLERTPWPNRTQPSSLQGHNSSNHSKQDDWPTIFLYDRSDAAGRKLANASLIRELLESSYEVRVDHWDGDRWEYVMNNQTTLQQAQIFNSYQYFLTPHGAHLVNLIHTRPNTKLLEIQCDVTMNRWRVHQQWFKSWSAQVGVDHLVHTEHDGCIEQGILPVHYTPKWVTVQNLTGLVTMAAEHFGLQEKKGARIQEQ